VNSLYPAAVAPDFVVNGEVYALPLYMDTLSLIYNKAWFDQAGIPNPPSTWQEFSDDIPKLRTLNAQGQLVKTAAGIGGTANTVPYAADIVQLLMFQNGAQIVDSSGRANFTGSTAEEAFQYYLNFANPSWSSYTWNEKQGNAWEDFFTGKTAMIFAYRNDTKMFADRSPFLDWSMAPVPQVSLDHTADVARYQGLAVWIKGSSPDWAWDFILYATTLEKPQADYLNATERLPALRTVIEQQAKTDAAPFVKQALNAHSWFMPGDANVSVVFSDAIGRALTGAATPADSLKQAEAELNRLFGK
jgi:multiple sugar transport system substrate-binding protein